ncbi:patatin-like phospholipase family protein [Arenibaculum pallidiluteum]|uniref:patatin-like phospholipase family protein n=1 Tax=Arenibaculum pallidiluteum TaxID=2812559 RepID=UPI001A97CDF5|nr:patatin-like phospholipase family protein [Arenibaculum pallidiluteum]
MTSFDPRNYEAWFPAERPLPEDGRFEIGLTLAGAVSAGAYTAGVMDFLFEALDAWEAAKSSPGAQPDGRAVPTHDVVVRIITGASAGGITGAIAAAWQGRSFEPARPDAEPARLAGNPFYRAWVKDIDITKLLDTTDLQGGREVRSALNSRHLDEIVETVLGGPPPGSGRRWLSDPLTLALTVTNLRGVPYALGFRTDARLRHQMTMHRDWVAFAVETLSGRRQEAPVPPDAAPLSGRADYADEKWRALGTTALATGAFPLALAPRVLRRPFEDYSWRRPRRGTEGWQFDEPAWPEPRDADPYSFLCVDGGTMDNEPLELARKALAGSQGRNPREGDRAKRAVIMVDPFADPLAEGLKTEAPLYRVALALANALKMQCRYDPADLDPLLDEKVYSRYLVAPSRGDGIRGREALASGGLGAFLGFFAEAYRHHDFMLGRRNCQRFLKRTFALPRDNPLFKDWRSRMTDADCCGNDPTHVPIVPLFGRCAAPEPLPDWPGGRASDLDRIGILVKARVHALVDALQAPMLPGAGEAGPWGWVKRTVTTGYLYPLRKALRNRIVTAVDGAIRAAVADVDRRAAPPESSPQVASLAAPPDAPGARPLVPSLDNAGP